jgi:N-formylglutamate amidohydrolase
LCAVLLLPAGLDGNAARAPGQTPAEVAKFLFLQRGDLPILLAAPHGGRQQPPGVPERQGVGVFRFNAFRDENTAELTERLAADLERTLGGKPYVVIARFDRKYVDANRPAEGAFESAKARPYYQAYHGALDEFCRAIRKKWGAGLLLDIHGQSLYPDAILRGTNDGETVAQLVKRHGRAALSGPKSLLGALEKASYAVQPRTGTNERESKYIEGYTVKAHGSHQKHGIDAMQLEIGSNLRQPAALNRTAAALAAAVRTFSEVYLPQAIRPTNSKKP